MIDLPVDQDDRADPGTTQTLTGLQGGIVSDLLVDVGRGIAQHPMA
jgi:hypothetical protein